MYSAHVRSCLAAAALLCCASSQAASDSSAPPPAPFLLTLNAPNAPGCDYFDLDNPHASFDIIIKNISSEPRSVGFLDCALQITAINGYKLATPCCIRPQGMWSAYAPQRVQPGEETVAHFLVSYLPKFYQVIPNSVYQMLYKGGRTSTLLHNDDRLVSGPFLPRLAGANSSRFEIITAVACYITWTRGKAVTPHTYELITYKIASAPVTFKTGL